MEFYGKTISAEITGWDKLSKIDFTCLKRIYNLDISNNGLEAVGFDKKFENNIKSITMKSLNTREINITQPTLEYLDMTDTTVNIVTLSVDNLKKLIGFNHNTLIGDEPRLTISNFKLPIDLSNFPSNVSIELSHIDYLPTGLDTIEKIDTLLIDDCKNINGIRKLSINDCFDITLKYIYKLNKIKINEIESLDGMKIIANIDLVSLELPQCDLAHVTVIVYANINLSEIIYDGISYGKEDDNDHDLIALCGKLNIVLYTLPEDDADAGIHKLSFNKLYINKEKGNYYNINPQIYKNRELIGEPLTGSSIDDIVNYDGVEYSYIKFPESTGVIINNPGLEFILDRNVINYNDNKVNITKPYNGPFVALGLNEYTAESLVDLLNSEGYEPIIFTDKPELLKSLGYYKVINQFNYAPDLPNVFGIKLVVY